MTKAKGNQLLRQSNLHSGWTKSLSIRWLMKIPRRMQVDLYYTFSMRLMAYLERISSNFTFLGNTGANPEKVEALGAITRKGGERVGTICEVTT